MSEKMMLMFERTAGEPEKGEALEKEMNQRVLSEFGEEEGVKLEMAQALANQLIRLMQSKDLQITCFYDLVKDYNLEELHGKDPDLQTLLIYLQRNPESQINPNLRESRLNARFCEHFLV
jgi:hypothetical protein